MRYETEPMHAVAMSRYRLYVCSDCPEDAPRTVTIESVMPGGYAKRYLPRRS